MRSVWCALMAAILLSGCLVPEPGERWAPPEQRTLDRLWADNPIEIVNHSAEHRTYRLALDQADTPISYINRVHIIAEADARVEWNWTVSYPMTAPNHEVSVLAMHAGSIGRPDGGPRATGAIHATRDDSWNFLVAGGGLQGLRPAPDGDLLEGMAEGSWRLAPGEEVIVDYGSIRHWVGHPRTHDIHVELDVYGPSHVLVAAHHTTRPWVEAGWGLFAQPFGPDLQVAAGPAAFTAMTQMGFEEPVPQASLVYAAGPEPSQAQAVEVSFHDEVHETPEVVVRTAPTTGAAWIDVAYALETDAGPFWLVANAYWPFLETWTPEVEPARTGNLTTQGVSEVLRP